MLFHASCLRPFLLIATGVLLSVGTLRAEPVSSAPFREALKMAEQIAGKDPEWMVFRCEGSSMGDFFGGNSLLLVKKSDFSEIREGMMVVYRKRSGKVIAHQVVEHHHSWLRTQGVMNPRPDPVYVRSEMVLGTVFGVLHTSGIPAGPVRNVDGQTIPVAFCKTF